MTVKTSNAVTATIANVTIMTLDYVGLQQQLHMWKCNKHMKIWVFWDVTLCCWLCRSQHFKCTMFLWTIRNYLSTTQHHTLEDLDRQQHCCEGITSCTQTNNYLSVHLTCKWPTFSYPNIEFRIDSRTNVRTCKHTYCNAGKSVCVCICWHKECTTRLWPCYSYA
jgi:hypothetical protein